MKLNCTICNKIVDSNLIDKKIGAYLNNKNKIVCFKCLK